VSLSSSAGPSTSTTKNLSLDEPFSSSIPAVGKIPHPYPIILHYIVISVSFHVLGTDSDIAPIPPLDIDESPLKKKKPVSRRGR
jgi:hypothetical protein